MVWGIYCSVFVQLCEVLQNSAAYIARFFKVLFESDGQKRWPQVWYRPEVVSLFTVVLSGVVKMAISLMGPVRHLSFRVSEVECIALDPDVLQL